MFTGIVEEVGVIKTVTKGVTSSKVTILAKEILEDLRLGDSIAVNGVCLTACDITKDSFTADIMSETLNRSSFTTLKIGNQVNLERAMSANGRFGGHIVTGHIDGTGTLVSVEKDDISYWITIKTSPKLLHYMIEKGSIAIDGISLTVTSVFDDGFQVSVIPHTVGHTTLLTNKKGSTLNLECDIVGKYIEKILQPQMDAKTEQTKIDMDFLRQHGFS